MLGKISRFSGERVFSVRPMSELVEITRDASNLTLKIREDWQELIKASSINQGRRRIRCCSAHEDSRH